MMQYSLKIIIAIMGITIVFLFVFLNAITGKLDDLEGSIDEMNSQITDLEGQVNDLDNRIQEFEY